MRKVVVFLTVFIATSIVAIAQTTQTIGNPNNIVRARGVFMSDSALRAPVGVGVPSYISNPIGLIRVRITGSDTIFEYHTGARWKQISGGGGGAVPLANPTSVHSVLGFNNSSVSVTCTAVPYAMKYHAIAATDAAFTTNVIEDSNTTLPVLIQGALSGQAYFSKIAATTTNPGNTNSGFTISPDTVFTPAGERILANNSFGTSALDASKWDVTTESSESISSVTSGKLTITGGSGALTGMYLLNKEYPRSLLGRWKQTVQVTIGSLDNTNSGTIFGGGIAIKGWTATGKYALYIQTTNWSSQYSRLVLINMISGGYVSSAPLSLSIGDKVNLTLTVANGILTGTAERLDVSNAVVETKTISKDIMVSPIMAQFGAKFGVVHLGGTMSFQDLKVVTNQTIGCRFLRVANSETYAFASTAASATQSLIRALDTTKSICENYGGGLTLSGLMSDSFAKAEIWALNPQVIYLALGTNDAGGSISSSAFTALISQFVSEAHTALPSATIIIRNIPPLSAVAVGSTASNNVPVINTALAVWCSAHSIPLLDIFTPLKASGSNDLDATYSVDGIHYNDAGMVVEKNLIVAAGVL